MAISNLYGADGTGHSTDKERGVADAPKSEPQKSPEALKKLEKPKNTEKPKAAKMPPKEPEQEPMFSEGKGGQLSFF